MAIRFGGRLAFVICFNPESAMPKFLFWVALLGLVLLLAGALAMRWAREPATAYAGTIGAGVGVLYSRFMPSEVS